MVRALALLSLSLAALGVHGFLGFGDQCIPVPSHLCAIAYDDDGCKVAQDRLGPGGVCAM